MKSVLLSTKCAAVVVAALVLFALPRYASSQAPAKQPAKQGTEKKSAARQSLLTMLDERIETKKLSTQDLTLGEVLGCIHDLLKDRGFEFRVMVDEAAFKDENPDVIENIFDRRFRFPTTPGEMTVADALDFALKRVPTKDATYVVMADHVLVLPIAHTSPEWKIHQKIRCAFEKCAVSDALHELSARMGTTIVIDSRAAEKAKTEISATFVNDIDLGGVLRVLTEMADLKVLVLDGAIFVTTPAHAELVRTEYLQRQAEFEKIKAKVDEAKKAWKGGTGPTGGYVPPMVTIDLLWPYVPAHYRSATGLSILVPQVWPGLSTPK